MRKIPKLPPCDACGKSEHVFEFHIAYPITANSASEAVEIFNERWRRGSITTDLRVKLPECYQKQGGLP